MEITETIDTESQNTFKEAVKIINRLSLDNQIHYHFSEITQKDKITVSITVENIERLLLLVRLHEQLRMSYEFDDIFIRCEDIMDYKPQNNINFRSKLLRRLISLLIIIAILMTIIITQQAKNTQNASSKWKRSINKIEYKLNSKHND